MVDHYRVLREERAGLLTSNLVVAETATRLRYDAGLIAAIGFRDLIERAVDAGRLTIRYVNEDLEREAWGLMERYSDQMLSFADCAGAATAREAGVETVFGLDADFFTLGFGLEPGPAGG